jgi:hypothetical protein
MVVLKSPLLLPILVWPRSPEAVPTYSCVCRAKSFRLNAVICRSSKRVQQAPCMEESLRVNIAHGGGGAVRIKQAGSQSEVKQSYCLLIVSTPLS